MIPIIFTDTADVYHFMFAGIWIGRCRADSFAKARAEAAVRWPDFEIEDIHIFTHCEYIEMSD